MPHPLLDVRRLGQSIWYDNIRRSLITSGELARMVADDGLLGVTSNPSIFREAIASDTDYDAAFERLVADGVGDAKELYERTAVQDIQRAADVLRPAFERAGGRDGFVSRIDTQADRRLEERLSRTRDALERARLEELRGKIAIANARLAYGRYREALSDARWKALAARGARPQRLLWASTSTKNPAYPKTLYVDELIGPDTVNTMPAETFEEFKKTGRARESLTGGGEARLEAARRTLASLAEVGISLREITDFLVADGVAKFAEAFDELLAAVARKREAILGGRDGRSGRLDRQEAALGEEARHDRFRHVVLFGMGGSSLCPEVLRQTFGAIHGHPELLVLDSTLPASVRRVADAIDPARTLFVVASKSGSTLEPNAMKAFFFDRVARAVGAERAGRHFVAITDPGTRMDEVARRDEFRHIVYGDPTIGGRFSALSVFGVAAAALLGLDPRDWLERAREMVRSCGASVPPAASPGVSLGVILGTLARQGRDKLTFVLSPGIAALGAWLEQLIAESTGKRGRGIVPVDGEPVGAPAIYGADRSFVYLRLASDPSAEHDAAVDALEAAGHPVVRIEVADRRNLGQEFFRFEIATAVAGALLGVDAFDQPDVEVAKAAARRLVADYEESGRLEADTPLLERDGIRVFVAPPERERLAAAAAQGLPSVLAAHLAGLRPGDYFALNAFVERCEAHDVELQGMRHAVRDARRVATTVGYGPRFLHSTGQLHKGGPPSGVFLQITADDAEDLAIPGQRASFGVLTRAQARGDFEVLVERGRRILRVHLGSDVPTGLGRLRAGLERALG